MRCLLRDTSCERSGNRRSRKRCLGELSVSQHENDLLACSTRSDEWAHCRGTAETQGSALGLQTFMSRGSILLCIRAEQEGAEFHLLKRPETLTMRFFVPISAALWLLMLSAAVVACPACDEPTPKHEVATLTPTEVHTRMLAKELTVLDANPAGIYVKHHVPGARRVEYNDVSISDLPKDKTVPVVFYCMNERCGASPIAARRARELGWSNVYLMPAGIQGWIAAGLRIESGSAPL